MLNQVEYKVWNYVDTIVSGASYKNVWLAMDFSNDVHDKIIEFCVNNDKEIRFAEGSAKAC